MKAFPTHAISVNNEARITSIGGEGGMDLRDYFAAKAMQGMFDYWHENPSLEFEHIASCSYGMADAMMKARQA
jgi:hypothetical protein